GGSITLNAAGNQASPGLLTIASGTFSADAVGGNNAGGTLNLLAGGLAVSGAGALTLSAQSTGSGAGGHITLVTLDPSGGANPGTIIVGTLNGANNVNFASNSSVAIASGGNISILTSINTGGNALTLVAEDNIRTLVSGLQLRTDSSTRSGG